MRRRSLYPMERHELCLLAPPGQMLPGLHNVIQDPERYKLLLEEAQRLRGGLYLADGAITPEELDNQQRYVVPDDARSWHILLLDDSQRVVGTTRMRLFAGTVNTIPIEELHAYQLILRAPESCRDIYRNILRGFIQESMGYKPYFCEAGGLGVLQEKSLPRHSVILIGSSWSLGRFIGGIRVIVSAASRNGSADILKGFGGRYLSHEGVFLEEFYDHKYKCSMHIQGFDSSILDPALEETVESIRSSIAHLKVYTH